MVYISHKFWFVYNCIWALPSHRLCSLSRKDANYIWLLYCTHTYTRKPSEYNLTETNLSDHRVCTWAPQIQRNAWKIIAHITRNDKRLSIKKQWGKTVPNPRNKERDCRNSIMLCSNLPPAQKWTIMTNGHKWRNPKRTAKCYPGQMLWYICNLLLTDSQLLFSYTFRAQHGKYQLFWLKYCSFCTPSCANSQVQSTGQYFVWLDSSGGSDFDLFFLPIGRCQIQDTQHWEPIQLTAVLSPFLQS